MIGEFPMTKEGYTRAVKYLVYIDKWSKGLSHLERNTLISYANFIKAMKDSIEKGGDNR